MNCPYCNQQVNEITATYEYTIHYDSILRRWVKDVGEVTYRHYADGCMEVFNTAEIADILKEVDEL